jgi:phosphoglycolate phosphatase-like HAD superfamily hydrolase
MRFLLFDIDGTLIDSGGAGIRALNHAFEDMFSVPDAFRTVSMAGKTDLQIVKEGMTIHGLVSSNGIIPEFFDHYIEHLKKNIDPSRGHLKAGIREALETLSHFGNMHTGLLTGNIEQGAMLKLEAFGIAGYFDIGAFGNEDEDRNSLLPIAVKKLRERRAVTVDYSNCVIIGDTPRDVECAKPYGAYTIGVATGPYSSESLVSAGADVVFQDLSDTERFIDALKNV